MAPSYLRGREELGDMAGGFEDEVGVSVFIFIYFFFQAEDGIRD